MHLKKPSFRWTDFSPSWTHKSDSLPNFGVNNGAFAQYHNEVLDMQAKIDELVRKNKSLRNKNKGTLLSCRVAI
jgi:hypothetical protein